MRQAMDVFMSVVTVLWCISIVVPVFRQGYVSEGVFAVVLCLLIPGDMVLAHWQHRYPWWAFWIRR